MKFRIPALTALLAVFLASGLEAQKPAPKAGSRTRTSGCLAAEEDFELSGHKFRAGAIIIPNADRAKLEPMLKDLGLSTWAVATPGVKAHELDVPRIDCIHSWTRTPDEGGDQKLRQGNPRDGLSTTVNCAYPITR